MYSDKGPPKGYSVPIHEKEGEQQRLCQTCSSTEHWTFECPQKGKPGKKPSARLSRTQMLKYGIKRKRTEFEPEMTASESFNAEMNALHKQVGFLEREAKRAQEPKADVEAVSHATKDGHSIKKEPSSSVKIASAKKPTKVKREEHAE